MIKLSPNFSLEELVKSDIAQRQNIKEQYTPDQLIVKKLTALCLHLLEPLKAAVEKAFPGAVLSQTSGYRCKRVNDAAGGSDASQHMAGEARDNEMRINGVEENLKLVQLIITEKIEYDQVIIEYGTLQKPEWIHTSWDLDKAKQRRMILRVDYDKEGKKRTYGMTEAQVMNIK